MVGAFGVVMLISGGIREQTDFDRFRGLGRRRPVLAVLLTVFLLSLAGIPPTAGFAAKVLVLRRGDERGLLAARADRMPSRAWPAPSSTFGSSL